MFVQKSNRTLLPVEGSRVFTLLPERRSKEVYKPVKRREWKKQLALMLCLVMIISLVNPFLVLAEDRSYDDLATENVAELYKAYMHEGQIGVSRLTDHSHPYHAYVLAEADISLSEWIYEGQSLEDKLVDEMNEVLSDGPDTSKVIYIADLYLAAMALGKQLQTDRLLDILIDFHNDNDNGMFLNDPDWGQFSNIPVYEILAKTGDINQLMDLGISIDYVLSLQQQNGNFSGSEDFVDFMITTQAVRVLKALSQVSSYRAEDIDQAITDATHWIKSTGQVDGSFNTGWDDPITNAAEVIMVLDALGNDLNDWKHPDTEKGPDDYLESISSYSTKNAATNAWALEAFLLLGAQPYFNPDNDGNDQGINPDVMGIRVRIEGRESTLFDEIVKTSNPKGMDVLIAAIGEDNIVLSDGFIVELLGETAVWEGDRSEYWGIYTVADNALTPASIGINDLTLENNGEMLLHFKDGYITKDTVIDIEKTGASTKLVVKKIDEVWTLDPDTGEWESASSQVVVEGATVSINGESHITNEKGEVTVNLDKGTYRAKAEKQGIYYPELIRHEIFFEIEAASTGGGGSSDGTTIHTTVTGKNSQNFYSGYMTLTSSDLHGMLRLLGHFIKQD
jgi:hypothetical protein